MVFFNGAFSHCSDDCVKEATKFCSWASDNRSSVAQLGSEIRFNSFVGLIVMLATILTGNI